MLSEGDDQAGCEVDDNMEQGDCRWVRVDGRPLLIGSTVCGAMFEYMTMGSGSRRRCKVSRGGPFKR